MMLRLLLTICLMIGLTAPCAEAAAWDEKDFSEWKESVTKSYETFMAERSALIRSGNENNSFSLPLFKLKIESHEWFEGDTYHIRYTFTNPTDEMLETTILRTKVLLHTNGKTPYRLPIVKQDPAPEWHLRIKPHSSITHTIILPKEPAFAHFIHEKTRFCLSDGSTLSYELRSPSILDITPVDIDFSVEPTALNKGILTLTITNHSSETLHELRNITIYTQTGKYSTYDEIVPLSAPISLDLRSNETKTLQIPVPLSDHLSLDSACTHYPDLDIDNLRYKYDRDKKKFTQSIRQNRYEHRPQMDSLAKTYPPIIPDVPIFGTMEPIKGGIAYYLTFYNNTDRPQKIDHFTMSSNYEDMFCTQKEICWSLSTRDNPIRLDPHESKRYVLALPIVSDTIETALASATTFQDLSLNRGFASHPNISAEPLSALQKTLYKPLRCSSGYFDIKHQYFLPID